MKFSNQFSVNEFSHPSWVLPLYRKSPEIFASLQYPATFFHRFAMMVRAQSEGLSESSRRSEQRADLRSASENNPHSRGVQEP
jgi:hypothetical protein